MGQKVNPIGIRLGITRDWTSKWYADRKQFPLLVFTDYRVRKLARRFVSRGHRVLVFGMIFDGRIGVAIQVGGKPRELLLQRGKLLLRALEGIARGIEGGLRSEIVGNQLFLALMPFLVLAKGIFMRTIKRSQAAAEFLKTTAASSFYRGRDVP